MTPKQVGQIYRPHPDTDDSQGRCRLDLDGRAKNGVVTNQSAQRGRNVIAMTAVITMFISLIMFSCSLQMVGDSRLPVLLVAEFQSDFFEGQHSIFDLRRLSVRSTRHSLD